MKRIPALWLAAMLIAVQPCYAVVMVGFGQSSAVCDDGLLTNGCFDDGTTYWSMTYVSTNTMTVTGGVLSYTENDSSYEGIKQIVTLTDGNSYTLTFDVIAISGSFYTYIGDTACTTVTATGTGQTATCSAGAVDDIRFIAAGVPVKSISIDNVKLVEN